MRNKQWEFEWDKADRMYKRVMYTCTTLYVSTVLAAVAIHFFYH